MPSVEGIGEERVWLDPGIGFGKTVAHNLELLRRLGEIAAIGRPVPGRDLPQAIPRRAHRPGGGRDRIKPGEWRPTCSPTSAAPGMLRVHDVAADQGALAVAGATVDGSFWKPICGRAIFCEFEEAYEGRPSVRGPGGRNRFLGVVRDRRVTGRLPVHAPWRHRGGAADRPADGVRRLGSTSRTAMRRSPTGSRTRSTTRRSARRSRWWPPSGPTGRWSGSAPPWRTCSRSGSARRSRARRQAGAADPLAG